MRTFLAVLLFTSTATAAPLVSPAARLPAVGEVPKACASAGRLASDPRPQFALGARVTLAECLANDALRTQTDLIDSQDSIAALDEAMARSLALLDQAIAANDPRLTVLAQHAKGAIYAALTTRMMASVPPLPTSPSDEQVQLRNQRVAVLATWLQPWHDKQHEAFAAVVAMVESHPRLASDPSLSSAISDSRKHVATDSAPNS